MGCLCPPKIKDASEQIRQLSRLRNQVTTTVELNKVKIKKLEKEIEEYDDQIKQGENDIRQNQYSYSDSEKQTKVKKLFELKKDRQRAQKSLDLLTANNENLKNNLQMLESKMNEINNNEQIKDGNEIIGQIDAINTGAALQQNIQNIMKQQQRDEENLRIINVGNNAVYGEMGLSSPDDYLKQILGNDNGTAGAAPAY